MYIVVRSTCTCINIILIGHHSRPVSGTNAELPAEVEYEYIAPPPHVHAVQMSRDTVNQSERPEGSSIPLSANESYNAINDIRF